ncbi:MAG: nucleoside deaminase [Prevotella sp.]|nr:nucleoside deaminase [Prevotella sp.]
MISFVSFSLSAHSQNKKEPLSGADVVSSDTLGRMELMRIAIAEAREGIRAGHGGPFGSVIVKNGKIVGRGHNCVLSHNDPTCHGEVAAIRDAGKNLKTFDLSGCELYTTGEPCHMCLCACMWANISKIYYGCTIEDNSIIGFRDGKFDEIFGGRDKLGDYMEEIGREECLKLFEEYNNMQHEKY